MVSIVHLFYSKPFFSTRGGVESGADYMVGGWGRCHFWEFLVGNRALACLYNENRLSSMGENRIHKGWGALSLVFFSQRK